MHYIEWAAQHLAGGTVEHAYLIPMSLWGGEQTPVYLGSGARSISLSVIPITQALQAAKVFSGVIAHNHVTESPPRPSRGDLAGVARLQAQLREWHMTLDDFIIVNSEGRVFSFQHQGIMANPINAGARFALEGEQIAKAKGRSVR
jgi:RadC-like JAB domain-containing protein